MEKTVSISVSVRMVPSVITHLVNVYVPLAGAEYIVTCHALMENLVRTVGKNVTAIRMLLVIMFQENVFVLVDMLVQDVSICVRAILMGSTAVILVSVVKTIVMAAIHKQANAFAKLDGKG